MNDYKQLMREAESLVIFKSLHNDKTFEGLLKSIQAIEEFNTDKSIKQYCDFVSELYEHSDNLTEYILKIVLENVNIYVLRKGEQKETGFILDECLANELQTIQTLAEISSKELTSKIDYKGFLPEYKTSDIDFGKIYADRIHHI
ncbi:MAG: ATP-binding protein, partial [Oscillospiraceae bacterium]